MGILNLFAKPPALLLPLPRGSFTVDREGRLIASTLPQAFPAELAKDIALEVLAVFRNAKTAHLTLNELVVRFANLKLTARELRGGAIVFLLPQTFSSQSS
jgi:hypothetical protein